MSDDTSKSTQNQSYKEKTSPLTEEDFNRFEQSVIAQSVDSKPIIRANCKFYVEDKYEIFQRISSIEDDIYSNGYEVKVYENIEVTNIEDRDEYKFFIRLEDRNGAYFVVELYNYKRMLTGEGFNEADYWRDKLDRISGISSSKHAGIARDIADYLALVIDRREFYYLQYKKIGWEKRFYDNYSGWIFKYDHIYSAVNPTIRGRVDAKRSYLYGTNPLSNADEDDRNSIQEAWVIFTQQLLDHKHVEDCVILGAGISGLIRQHLGRYKELGINMNICGKPASGKTTIGQFLLGIFGPAEELEGSFIDTDNAREVIRSERPVLPYVFDDRLLKDYDKPRDKAEVSFIFDIFREYNGGTKERLGKQWEEISGEPTYSPMISSSVDSALDLLLSASRKGRDDVGQYRRFIEIYAKDSDDAILFENAEEANIAMEFAKKDYGYGIEVIANYMVELLDQKEKRAQGLNDEANIIVDRFNDIRDRLINNINHENIQDFTSDLRASVNKFALIILSYQILKESLDNYISTHFYGMDTDESEIKKNDKQKYPVHSYKDRSDEIYEFLKNNLIEKYIKKRHAENKQYRGKMVYDYVMSNNSYFIEKGNISHKSIGEIIENSKKQGKIIVGYYYIENYTITVYTFQRYGIHHLWSLPKLPKIEEVVKQISEIDNGADMEKLVRERYNLSKKDISRNNKDFIRSNDTGGENLNPIRKFVGAITEYDMDNKEEE